MRQKSFVVLFISFHVLLIVLQIYKQNYLVELSYRRQKHEKAKQVLVEKKNMLVQQWHVAQSPASIKEYATKQLGMKKIALAQIKQLPA